MTIKDRGSIKWTALMLPEHKKRLKQLIASQEKIPRPDLDEQHLNRMENILNKAAADGRVVVIIYYQNGYLHRIKGRIITSRPDQHQIMLQGPSGPCALSADEIIDIIY